MREKKRWDAGMLGRWEVQMPGCWEAWTLGGTEARQPETLAKRAICLLFRLFRTVAIRFLRHSIPTSQHSSLYRPYALTLSRPHVLMSFTLLLLLSATAFADGNPNISSLLKKNDACMLLAPDRHEVVSIHGDTSLIPASTLKIFTSLVAFHYLGADYRFPTEIYISDEGDLTVKGYGDPRLISEVLQQLAVEIKAGLPEGTTAIRDMILDDTYFTSPLTIPGVSDSREPYDAPNGALCANFNTINFKKLKDGSYVSGEEQTPLLPAVLDRVKKSGLREGRIPLSKGREETTGYTGHLLAWYLRENGITMTGNIRFAAVDTERSRRLLTFRSPYRLSEVVSALLEYSNNFMANQILIAAGARADGCPGNLEKGVRAAKVYAMEQLHFGDLNIAEGSGISRENRITARRMLTVLKAFSPYRALLRHEDYVYYKTGTLKGVASRIGYLMDGEGNAYPFVVMLNDSERNMGKVMEELKLRVP